MSRSTVLYLSLGANLLLLLALATTWYLYPETAAVEPEVIVRERVVNPNIALETELIGMRTKLEAASQSYENEIQELTKKLEESEIVISDLEQGLLPPLVVPEGPRGHGKAYGDVQHKMMLLAKDFPDKPSEDSTRYEEYILRLDEIMQGVAPLHIGIAKYQKLPESDSSRIDFLSSTLASSLGVSHDVQEQIRHIYYDSYKKAHKANIITSESRRNDFNVNEEKMRREISGDALNRIKVILNAEQAELLENNYYKDNVLYRPHAYIGL